MQSYDIKKERRALYAPRAGRFETVDVPELGFLMVDGHGDPNVATAYREAVEALYTASYAAFSERSAARISAVRFGG